MPSFQFDITGNHNVTLNVTDAAGNWDTDAMVVIVNDDIVPLAEDEGNTALITIGALILVSSFLIILWFVIKRKG